MGDRCTFHSCIDRTFIEETMYFKVFINFIGLLNPFGNYYILRVLILQTHIFVGTNTTVKVLITY